MGLKLYQVFRVDGEMSILTEVPGGYHRVDYGGLIMPWRFEDNLVHFYLWQARGNLQAATLPQMDNVSFVDADIQGVRVIVLSSDGREAVMLRVQGRPGAKMTLEWLDLDNVNMQEFEAEAAAAASA